MAQPATRGRGLDAFISENVPLGELYQHTKFHAFNTKFTIFLKSAGLLEYTARLLTESRVYQLIPCCDPQPRSRARSAGFKSTHTFGLDINHTMKTRFNQKKIGEIRLSV